MILIYSEKLTNRVKFIFHLFFTEVLNTEFKLTSNVDEFVSFEGAKINYSKLPIGDEFFIAAENLLFERGISYQKLSFVQFQELPAFYPTYHKKSVLPFDIFAASFYMVTRYEEYLPYKKDEYGRFSSFESIAHKKGFLQKPIVNFWVLHLAGLIKKAFPDWKYKGTKYKFIPTIDIDAAWAYRQKGLFRTLGGFINSISRLDLDEFTERIKVLAGFQKDPFDTYDFHLELQKKYHLKPIFFILFAEYGFNDKNIPVYNSKFKTLIKSLADYVDVGIHPSYGSNSNAKKLRIEVERLSKVINREITKSRQHFLKLDMPSTYRNLINLDIEHDYSMGFAAQPGFRAGICVPYNFFDLDLDAETHLRIHPFTLMDGTLRDYMNVSAENAMKHIKPLIDEVRKVNGTFYSLWHNESIGNSKRWTGWHHIYEEMIIAALP
jgi:hypothetical protein